MSKRRIIVWCFALLIFALSLATLIIYSKRRDLLSNTLTERLTTQGWTDLDLQISEVGKEQLEVRALTLKRRFGERSISINIKDATVFYTPKGLLDGRVTRIIFSEGTIDILDGAEPTDKSKPVTPPDIPSLLNPLRQIQLEEVNAKQLQVRWQKGDETTTATISGTVRKDPGTLSLYLTGKIAVTNLVYTQLTVPTLSGSTTQPLKVRYDFDNERLDQLAAELALSCPSASWGKNAISIENIQTRVAASAPSDIRQTKFTLRDTSAKIFGGALRIPESSLSLNDKQHELTLKLEALELDQILALYRQEKIAVTGTIDGSLPISFGERGISVEQGTVEARAPGGTISYQGPTDELLGDVEENPNLALVAQALRNFRYSALNAKVAYGASGDLVLQVQSSGKNPDVLNGREINLNINLEDNIPKLLKSLSIGSDIAGKLESNFKQQQRKGQ